MNFGVIWIWKRKIKREGPLCLFLVLLSLRKDQPDALIKLDLKKEKSINLTLPPILMLLIFNGLVKIEEYIKCKLRLQTWHKDLRKKYHRPRKKKKTKFML